MDDKKHVSSCIFEPYDEKVFLEGLTLEQLREYAKTIKLRTIFPQRVSKKTMKVMIWARIYELERETKDGNKE